MSHSLRVLVVGQYPSIRAGLRAMLERADGLVVTGELAPSEGGDSLTPPDADVAVADLGDDPAADINWLDRLFPGLPAVLLAPDTESFRWAFAQPAARAWLLKDAPAAEIAAAVRAVADGLVVLDPSVAAAVMPSRFQAVSPPTDEHRGNLTERELEVLRLLAEGLPNKSIARALGISEHTAKFHVGAIFDKLGAGGRTEAVMLAARRGLIAL